MVHLQRRDKGVASFILLMMVVSVFGLSYAVNNVTGLSQSSELSYNVTDQMVAMSNTLYVTNGSGSNWRAQTDTFDNTTKDIIVASYEYISLTSSNTWIEHFVYLNTTGTDLSDLSKIVITWNYVGSGNVTGVVFGSFLPTSKYFECWGHSGSTAMTHTAYDPGENGTYTFVPETFEKTQLVGMTRLRVVLTFRDGSNLPIDTDYMSVRIQLYAGTLLLTSTQLLQLFAGALGVVWIIGAFAISKFWNPGKKKSYNRRS